MENPTARATSENQHLNCLWNSYHESSVEDHKQRLSTFLDYLVRSSIINTGFENENNVTQLLYQLFQERIRDYIGESVAQKLAVFDYLREGEGFLLLLSIAKLTKRSIQADPSGLCDIAAQSLCSILDLSISSFTRDKSTLDPQLAQIAKYKFESIENIWLQYSPSPSPTHKLFSSIIPEKHQEKQLKEQDHEINDDTTVGFISFYLLDIIGNLTKDDFAITELVSMKRIDPLLALLSRNPQDLDDGMITVHRKLARSLSRILSHSLRSGYKWIPVFTRELLIPSLLEASATSSTISNLVLQEISQCLISLLVESTRYSFELMNLFEGLEGFIILGKNLEEVSKNGSLEQQTLLLKTFCQLLFLHEPKPSISSEAARKESNEKIERNNLTENNSSQIQIISKQTGQQVKQHNNQDDSRLTLPPTVNGITFVKKFFQVLLRVFSLINNHDMKTLLLNTILEIVLIGFLKHQQLTEIGLCSTLLDSTFHSHHLYHKYQILKIIKKYASTNGLSASDALVHSRVYGESPSITSDLILAIHMIELLKKNILDPRDLSEAGFGLKASKWIEIPNIASPLYRTLDSSSKQLGSCIAILTKSISESNQDLKVQPTSQKVEETCYQIVATLLYLLKYFLKDNPSVQVSFNQIACLKNLMEMIKEKRLRRPALDVFSVVALGDILGQSTIIRDLMSLLNSRSLHNVLSNNVPILYQDLEMYVDVLGTMKFIMQKSANMKNVFRDNGGFTWILANIKTILLPWNKTVPEADGEERKKNEDNEPSSTSPSTTGSAAVGSSTLSSSEENLPTTPSNTPRNICEPSYPLFFVLTELLDTLGTSLKGNHSSKEGFAWGWFSLNDLFTSSRSLFRNPSLIVSLANSLLSIAVSGGWPSQCTNHVKSIPGSWHPEMESSMALPDAPLAMHQTLLDAKSRISDCKSCKAMMMVEIPQALKLTVDLLNLIGEEASAPSESLSDSLDLQETSTSDSQTSKYPIPSQSTSNSDDEETAFIIILKSFKLLLDEYPDNARILSSDSTGLHILSTLKPILLMEKHQTSKSRQPLLLQLVETICSYSISLSELHKFIELLRVPTCPTNILQTLCSISMRTISSNYTPHAFLTIPASKDEIIRSPSTLKYSPELKWPPKQGYTISLWFEFDTLPGSGSKPTNTNEDGSTLPVLVVDMFRLFALDGKTEKKSFTIEALITEQGNLHLRSSVDQTGIVFDGFSFVPGNWYHLTISHIRTPTTTKNPKAVNGSILVWVNGIKRAAANWSLVDPFGAQSFFCSFGSSSKPFQYSETLSPRTNTPRSSNSLRSSQNEKSTDSLKRDTSTPTTSTSWHLGNAIAFDLALQSDTDVLGLYLLGPNYTGGFSSLNLQDFRVPNSISPAFIASSISENTELLLDPGKISLHPLHEHILFFFSSTEQIFACRTDNGLKATHKSRSCDLEPFPAEICADVGMATRLSVSDVIQYAGGLSTMLYYFATAQHPQQQKITLNIIRSLIAWNSHNARELREMHGYLIIARVIRKLEWIIDEELLAIVFAICGFSRSSKRGSYSDGIVNNIEAFQALLLDWKVWKRAPNKIKLLLFRSLADIVSVCEQAAFNAWYLQKASARTSLLLILEDPLFPYQLAQYAITAISYLMHDPWTPGDMKATLRFMIATHPISSTDSSFGFTTSPVNDRECPLGVAHKLSHFNGIQAQSLPVRFEAKYEDSDPSPQTNDDESDSESVSTPAKLSKSESRASTYNIPGDQPFPVDNEAGPTRDLILTLLLDMLQQAKPEIVLNFFEICTKEVILTLLQTPVLSTRLVLLKILQVYFRHPSLAASFKRMDGFKADLRHYNGFRLLGEILRQYEPEDEILSILFTILLGKSVSYNVLKTSGVTREGKELDHIEHPEIISTLLVLATGCYIDKKKIHTIVQIIYDLTLHSESVKQGFLQAGLIEHLCQLFVFELEHRIGRLSAKFMSKSQMKAKDGDSERQDTSTERAEETQVRLRKNEVDLHNSSNQLTKDGTTFSFTRVVTPDTHNAKNSVEEQIEDDNDHIIEQDVLRFLRTLIISPLGDGDSALAMLQQVMGVINALPLPFQYIATLEKQVAYDALDILNGFDFTSDAYYEKLQKICTFIINLVIYLERSSSTKSYQLSRVSSLSVIPSSPSSARKDIVSLPASPNPSSDTNSRFSISNPATPAQFVASTPYGNTPSSSVASRSKSRRVTFWEVLESFDNNSDSSNATPSKSSTLKITSSSSSIKPSDKQASNSDLMTNSQPTNTQSSNELVVDSNNEQSSEITLSTFSDSNNSESDHDFLIPTATSSTSVTSDSQSMRASTTILRPNLLDLSTEEFSIVTRRAWASADFLTDDLKLVQLIFKVFDRQLQHKKATTSTFKKIGETLRHKMVGVTSLDDIATNVSWHIERLVFHILKDRPVAYPELVEFALSKVASITIPGSFLSETEFLSRFLRYSSRLLGGSRLTWMSSSKQSMTSSPQLAAATLSCWKSIISSTSNKVISRILSSQTVRLIQDADGAANISPENVEWSEGLADRVQRIEGVDNVLRREWSRLFKSYIDDYSSNAITSIKSMRDLVRNCSDKYLKKVENVIKPSLKRAEQAMQNEKWIRSQWKAILGRVTHQRAAWPIHRSLLRWELDPTEGPLRTRLRLMPVYAHKHPIIGGEGYTREKYSHDPKDVYLTSDLDAKKVELLKHLENQLNENELSPNATADDETPVPQREQVVKYFSCSRITPFHKRDGELVIGAMNAYFIDSHKFKDEQEAQRKYTSVKKHSTWPYDQIKEIHKRRHLLINNALEIFLINGRTYLLSFRTPKDRDTVYDMLIIDRKLPNFVNYESEVFISGKWTKMSITDKWRKGLITNFEYLMHLNTLSGRTYNDLTQYPVFPYILKDYTSQILNLDNPNSFRELDLPMGAQDPKRLLKFIEKYQALLELAEDKPYFYGSHYSNVGSVLHFLVRLEPFSQYFIEFQSGRFDVPDRVFHSVGQSWDLSSSQSQSDVKELIPEFFYLPEFLVNNNHFPFGTKQDGTKVNNVVLPNWAHNSARFFIYRHMEALESEHVSFQIHNWIDLIFGYRQTGEDSILARNRFHPYTYEGAVDISKISDQIERDAIITQINSYGQTPTQLFKNPHPKRSDNYLRSSNPDGIHVAVDRLQVFPAMPWPSVRKLHFLNGAPVALGPRQELLWPSGTHYLQWGNWDGSLRAINLKTKQVDFEPELFSSFRDRLTCVDVSKNGRVIAAGSESGLVRIWQKTTQTHINKNKEGSESNQASMVYGPPPSSPTTNTLSASSATPVLSQPGVGAILASATPSSIQSKKLALSGTPSTLTSSGSFSQNSPPEYTPSAILSGHSVDVSCIRASSDHSIIVSGAKDGSVIVWDSNRLKFVRTLRPAQPSNHPVSITHIEVMMYTAEIVIIEDHVSKGYSKIVLCSVNGDLIASRTCPDKIGAMTVTSEKPGLARNIIITGHQSGEIKFWSAFDLSPVRTLERTQKVPVTALCVSDDFGCLFAGHASNSVVTCHASKPAKFIS